MKNLILPLVLVIVVVTGSCKKEDKLSATQLLTRADWKLIEHVEKFGNGPEVDELPNYEPCEKDNIYSFKADGTYLITEGTSKCETTDPDIVGDGFWELLNEGTELSADDEIFKIERLDKDRFTISILTTAAGQPLYTRQSFVH